MDTKTQVDTKKTIGHVYFRDMDKMVPKAFASFHTQFSSMVSS